MVKDVIDVVHLSKMYGDHLAVDDVNFKIKSGEIFAFLGPNGAGKSTTIKMLTTLLSPTKGTMHLGGYDVVREKSKVRSSFGIVFQDPSLDDELTAYENMELHAVLYHIDRAQIDKRIEDMLNLVELWDKRKNLVKTFSGGMKRRLEIARGLLHSPQVLFLDEPTIGLDTQTRNHLWDYIKKLNKNENMTIFFTTHYIEEAENVADRIAIIDHGKIIAHGTVAELIKQTDSKNLEDAYLDITGKNIREEEIDSGEAMRMRMRARRGRH